MSENTLIEATVVRLESALKKMHETLCKMSQRSINPEQLQVIMKQLEDDGQSMGFSAFPEEIRLLAGALEARTGQDKHLPFYVDSLRRTVFDSICMVRAENFSRTAER